MKLEGQAYPFLDTTRGNNLPAILHPGLSKEELLYVAAMQGALASGKEALDAVKIANDVVDAYKLPVEDLFTSPKDEKKKWK